MIATKKHQSVVKDCQLMVNVETREKNLLLNGATYLLQLGTTIILTKGKATYQVYEVTDHFGNRYWTCTCPWAAQWGRGAECKHTKALKLLSYIED